MKCWQGCGARSAGRCCRRKFVRNGRKLGIVRNCCPSIKAQALVCAKLYPCTGIFGSTRKESCGERRPSENCGEIPYFALASASGSVRGGRSRKNCFRARKIRKPVSEEPWGCGGIFALTRRSGKRGPRLSAGGGGILNIELATATQSALERCCGHFEAVSIDCSVRRPSALRCAGSALCQIRFWSRRLCSDPPSSSFVPAIKERRATGKNLRTDPEDFQTGHRCHVRSYGISDDVTATGIAPPRTPGEYVIRSPANATAGRLDAEKTLF